jgi:competence protein ComEC
VARAPQALAWGRATAIVLNPEPAGACTDHNRASLALLLDLGEVEALLAADIDEEAEADLLANGLPLAAEVLKVAHHGSASGSSAAFLAAVQPGAAVLSVGENSYGHPAPETLRRLSAAGAQLWRTDLLGTVTLHSDGLSYRLAPVTNYLPAVFQAIP